MIPKIKICGIKKPSEINCLNKLNIDYVGFVFAKSKRQITIEQAKELKQNLSKNIKSVAVVVEPNKELLKQISNSGFDIIQWHGKLYEEVINKINIPLWQAVSVNNFEDMSNLIYHKSIIGYIFDGRKPGSGKTFDWTLLESIKLNKPLILAGGLSADNIKMAIEKIHPDIVDVSSGVENHNGKDLNKIKEFVRKVREFGTK
ncbi:MAG: phosphoribosylanthranilate isomerase [Eubacteriales bacterium]